MRYLLVLILICLQSQVGATTPECSRAFGVLSELSASERETFIIDAYLKVWTDLRGNLKDEDVAKFLDSGEPLRVPKDVILETESFKDTLDVLSQVVESDPNSIEIKVKLLAALKAKTQRVRKTQEKQAEADASEPLRISWPTKLTGFTTSGDGKLMGGYGDVLPPKGNFLLFDREKKSFQRLPWLEMAQKTSATLAHSGRFILVHQSNPMEIAKYTIQDGRIQEPYVERMGVSDSGGQSLRSIRITPDDSFAFASTNFTSKFARYHLNTRVGEWLLGNKQVYSFGINPASGKIAVLAKNGKKMEVYYENPDGSFSKPIYTHDTVLSPMDGFGVASDGSKIYITERDVNQKNPQLLEIPIAEQSFKDKFWSFLSLKPRETKKRAIDFRLPVDGGKEIILKEITIAPSGDLYLHLHFENEEWDSVRRIELSDGPALVQEIYEGKDFGEISLSFIQNALLVHSPKRGTLTFLNP